LLLVFVTALGQQLSTMIIPPDAIRVGADWRFDRLSVSRPYVSMISLLTPGLHDRKRAMGWIKAGLPELTVPR
jgi:hypothetical protein